MAKFGLGLILPIINPQAGIFYNTGIATILKQVFNLVVLILLSIVFLVLHLMVLELVLILSLVLVSLFSLINPKACTSSNGFGTGTTGTFQYGTFPFNPQSDTSPVLVLFSVVFSLINPQAAVSLNWIDKIGTNILARTGDFHADWQDEVD